MTSRLFYTTPFLTSLPPSLRSLPPSLFSPPSLPLSSPPSPHSKSRILSVILSLPPPYLVASISGVQPVLVWWLTSDCRLRRRLTTLSWPFQQARVSGVSSLLPDGSLILAWWSKSSSVASKCPSLSGGSEENDIRHAPSISALVTEDYTHPKLMFRLGH